jgi:hypothetical protein
MNQALASPYKGKIDQWTIMVSHCFGFEETEQNYSDYIKPWYVDVRCYSQYIRAHGKKAYTIGHQEFLGSCDYVFATIFEEHIEKAKKEDTART